MKKFIYSTLLVLATSLVACTEDFTDWAQPQQNDQPEVVTFGNGSVSAVSLIDFANIPAGQALVKVCNVTAPTSSDADYSNTRYELHLDNGAVSELSNNGEVTTEFLKTVVEQEFGKAPKENKMIGVVEQWITNGETTIKAATSSEFEIKVKLTAPVIEEAYYYVGTSNNWDISDATYQFSHSDQNVYDDPIFTLTVPAPYKEDGTRDDMWFKFTPKSSFDAGSWDGLLGCEIDGDESLEGKLIVDGQAIKMPAEDGAKFYKIKLNMMEYSYSIETVSFEQYIYFIGATDGWTNAEQKLALTDSDNGVYTGFIYCADPNGWGNQFKFQRVAGDWGTELNSGHFTSYVGDVEDCGGNIGVTGGENVYFFSVNLSAGEISATEVQTMGIVGGFNGWGAPDIAMTWNATAYCYEANIADVTGEWKFRINEDWTVNLGESLNDLVANGGNLNVTGTTVQLYPTRKSGDNIFATIDGEVAQEPEPGDETFEPYAYLPGDANGWGFASDILLGNGSGKYTGFAVVGGEYGWKVSQFPNWDNGDYGLGGEDGTLKKGGGNIMEGSEAKPYWVEVDLAGLTYKLTEVTAMSLIGNAVGGWSDDNDVFMTWNLDTKSWSVTTDLAADVFKFRANHGWGLNLGGDNFDSLWQDGPNLSIAEAGNYTITLYPSYDGVSHCTVVKN